MTYGGYWFTCTAGNSNQAPLLPPFTSAYWSAATSPKVHARGMVTLPGPVSTDPSRLIKTQLVATLTYGSLFVNALAATSTVTLNSGVAVDSYDSSLGTYNQITSPFSAGSPNRGSSAVLAGGNNAASAVRLLGTVSVNGYVAVPSGASPAFLPLWSYTVGTTVLTGVIPTPPPAPPDLSRVSRSPYMPAFAPNLGLSGIDLPFAQGVTQIVGSPGATAPTVYRALSGLEFTDPLTVLTIDGPVVINVSGNVDLGNFESGAKIVIKPWASAEIHFTGTFSCNDVTGGGIENQSLDPLKLVFVGTGSSANTFNSTLDFYGAIYTPNAAMNWDGGILYGAISATDVTITGGPIHYDGHCSIWRSLALIRLTS